ncbi:hypothetical protein DPMN_125368 [Dreissena polymorpha]|uniref:carbonic anhydrase n=1 Tax=Dreissena polymorpha TaxID=45954 RepID=A0A9D4GTU7_DREPO|nr:hypothetical protein DPMN_125368 [Dreissena polymorpha]
MDVSLCDDSISESESDNESVPESDHESVPEPGKETESETPDSNMDTFVHIYPIPMIDLMPARLANYYRYVGSLTTPPCYESVTWTIFNETIEIAEEQLVQFRTTIFENDKSDGGVSMDLSDDYRPVQCMFRRRLYASHPSLKYNAATQNVMVVGDGNSAASNEPHRISLFFMCSAWLWFLQLFFSL